MGVLPEGLRTATPRRPPGIPRSIRMPLPADAALREKCGVTGLAQSGRLCMRPVSDPPPALMPDSILATDPARLGIAEAAELIARHALSPVELHRAVLDRIAARDGALQPLTVMGDTAMAAARQPRREIAAGPARPAARHPLWVAGRLRHGGHPHDSGAPAPAGRMCRPPDATLHARLQAAGAILIGKHKPGNTAPAWATCRTTCRCRRPTTPGTRTITRRGRRTAPASPVAAGFCALGLWVRIPAARSGCQPRRMG